MKNRPEPRNTTKFEHLKSEKSIVLQYGKQENDFSNYGWLGPWQG